MFAGFRFVEAPRRLRAFVRAHEASLVLLAALIGLIGGLAVGIMGMAVAGLHELLFHIPAGEHLSSQSRVDPIRAMTARLADQPEPPTRAEVEAISPVPKARLRVCLDLLASRGVLRATPDSRYELVRRAMDRDQLAREGRAYREREERDAVKLAQLIEYAEGRTCRWKTVLGYFGDEEELPAGKCGHCDVC